MREVGLTYCRYCDGDARFIYFFELHDPHLLYCDHVTCCNIAEVKNYTIHKTQI
jgi:hypothetical protein